MIATKSRKFRINIGGTRTDWTLGIPGVIALITVVVLTGACAEDAPPLREGMVRFEGTLTSEGVECSAMRGEGGELYTLVGDIAGPNPGDRVCVEGTVAEFSICQQGTTINVERITNGACSR